jgi:hypothetical protein
VVGLFFFQGSLSFILASKLKAMKVDLKRWNEKVVWQCRKEEDPFG